MKCPSVESHVSAAVTVNAMIIYMGVSASILIRAAYILLQFPRYQAPLSEENNHMPRLYCIRMRQIQDSNNMIQR